MLPELGGDVWTRQYHARKSVWPEQITSYYIDTYAGGKSGNPICPSSVPFPYSRNIF